MKTKSDTITEIMRINPSVGATFLSEFSNDDLMRYLRRLRDLREPTHRSAQKLSLHAAAMPRPEALQSA